MQNNLQFDFENTGIDNTFESYLINKYGDKNLKAVKMDKIIKESKVEKLEIFDNIPKKLIDFLNKEKDLDLLINLYNFIFGTSYTEQEIRSIKDIKKI
jgi:hypothetical protein